MRLRHRFAIARGFEDVSQTLIVRLFARGIEALGEVTPSSRYDENVELIEGQLRAVVLDDAKLLDVDATLAQLPSHPTRRDVRARSRAARLRRQTA